MPKKKVSSDGQRCERARAELEKCMNLQETLDLLFPPAKAESVMKLMVNIECDEIGEKPVMVDSTGQPNIVSSFASMGKATHDNLFSIIPVGGEEI